MIHYLDKDGKYLCNKSCGVNPEKISPGNKNYNCCNCKKMIKNRKKKEKKKNAT